MAVLRQDSGTRQNHVTSDKLFSHQVLMLHKKFCAIRAILMLHKGYTKFIMPAGIMSSASISIIRSNPIISADLSGLSVIRSFIIRMNPVYDKTDGGLNGFHRSTSLFHMLYLFKNYVYLRHYHNQSSFVFLVVQRQTKTFLR